MWIIKFICVNINMSEELKELFNEKFDGLNKYLEVKFDNNDKAHARHEENWKKLNGQVRKNTTFRWKATGGFVLKDGKLVKEKVVRVTSFATKKSFDKNRSKVIKQVGAWGNKWKQEAVSYEHEGDLFIITPTKVKRTIVKRTTQQKKVMLSNLVKARRIKAKNL